MVVGGVAALRSAACRMDSLVTTRPSPVAKRGVGKALIPGAPSVLASKLSSLRFLLFVGICFPVRVASVVTLQQILNVS
jgi:hypothetical protein